MRPQDIVILLYIIVLKDKEWRVQDLAHDLGISISEVSKALDRMKFSGLLDHSKKEVARATLYDFIIYGLRYVFPVQLGKVSRGLATSHSAKIMKKHIVSNVNYVWPSFEGKVRGESVEPLYPALPEAALKNQKLYDLCALVDAIRIGRAREVSFARKILRKRIVDGE